jgi:threonine/homoserine/homoserine lactone efflux protein
MCFDSLVDGEYDEKPMTQLLREEFASAFKVGSVAALVVVGVLAASATPGWVVASASAGAVVLGVAMHLTVLVAGVSALRLHSHRTVALQKPTS